MSLAKSQTIDTGYWIKFKMKNLVKKRVLVTGGAGFLDLTFAIDCWRTAVMLSVWITTLPAPNRTLLI